MFLTRLAPGALLLGLPIAGLAQRPGLAPTPRFYGGLALYSSTYQPLGGDYRGVTVPVQLTLGYQLRPRLALQAAVAYSGSKYAYFNLGKYYYAPQTSGPYTYFEYEGTDTWRNTSVALLARYTLTRQPAHHLQVDLLGGFTLEHESYANANTRTDSDSTHTTSVTTYSDNKATRNNLLLTAGAGARYHFGQHLEAVLDITLSTSLLRSQLTWATGLTSATALGLRYRFGH